MSSKYLEKAWSHKTVNLEDKLLLVALAELSDRDGAFITSMAQLREMMCASESMIDNLIAKLSMEQVIIGVNKASASYRSSGKINGRLNFDTYVEQGLPNSQAGYAQPHGNQDVYSNAKRVSSFHRSQVTPVNKTISGKAINILELSPNVIEPWAEAVMFKSGYGNQTQVWASFVERVRETPSKQLYSLDELRSRLHSHLHSEKSYKQGYNRSSARPQTVKRGAIDILEEKIANFNFKNDDEGDDLL